MNIMAEFNGNSQSRSVKNYIFILAVLTIFFTLRVLAQLIQYRFNLKILPSFEVWQSGVLFYGSLLLAQIIIIGLCVRTIYRMKKNKSVPSRTKGKVYLILGSIYFLTMLVRLIAGFTVAQGHYWLDVPLPSFFHLVLATFVLTLGMFHYRSSTNQAI